MYNGKMIFSITGTGKAICVLVLSCSVMSYSLRSHGLYSLPSFSVYGDSLGKNTGVGYHSQPRD